MNKVLKFLVFSILTIVLLVFVLVVLLFAFVDPNTFKPIIEKQVYKTTGRTLNLKGDIHWTIFPSIGLKFSEAKLSNTESFDSNTFASIDRAKVSMKILPMIRKEVEVDELSVDGLSLNLVKNKEGKSNWDDLISVKYEDSKKTQYKKNGFKFKFSEIKLKNMTIYWSDLSTGEKTKIDHIDFRAEHIHQKLPFPVKLSLYINKKPNVEGRVKFYGDLRMNDEKKQYILENFEIVSKLRGASLPDNKLDLDIKGNLFVTQNSLKADPIKIKMNDSNILGNITITDLSNWKGNFNFNADNINIGQFGESRTTKSKANNTSSLKLRRHNKINFLQKINMIGQVKINRLKIMDLKATQFKASTKLSDGIISISPITAVFYRGSINGSVNVNAKQDTPRVSLNGKLNNVDMQLLISDLMEYKKIVGTGNLSVNLSCYGFNAQNLNGNMTFEVRDGVLKGINIPYLVNVGKAVLVKQIPPIMKEQNQTDFGNLTGTALINKGIISNNDLYLLSKSLEVKGRGEIDLVKEYINYDLDANLLSNKNFVVPIEVKGHFSNVKTSVDEKRLLLKAAKHQLEKHKDVIKKRTKEIQKKLKSRWKNWF